MHCQSLVGTVTVPKTAAVLRPLHGHGNPLQHAGGGATEALQSSPKDGTPTYIILSNRAVLIAISIF